MATVSHPKLHVVPNVTPMIDVMLVLLIIFMVITPVLMRGFVADPPVALNAMDRPDSDEDRTLGIDQSGQWFLDGRPIAKGQLAVALAAGLPGRGRTVLLVRADRSLDFSAIQEAVDEAARGGIHVVGLISVEPPRPGVHRAGDGPGLP